MDTWYLFPQSNSRKEKHSPGTGQQWSRVLCFVRHWKGVECFFGGAWPTLHNQTAIRFHSLLVLTLGHHQDSSQQFRLWNYVNFHWPVSPTPSWLNAWIPISVSLIIFGGAACQDIRNKQKAFIFPWYRFYTPHLTMEMLFIGSKPFRNQPFI